MQKYDATVLAQNLNALAEVYERKPVTAKALEMWFDILKEFPTERIMGILLSWPKTHTKFPAPAEVWKVCNEASITEREMKSRAEAAENSKKDLAWHHKSPAAEAALKKMAEIVGAKSRAGSSF